VPVIGWTELLALLTSVGFGVISAIVPVANAEAYVIGSQVSALAGPVPIAVGVGVGQMFGKLILFLSVRQGKELPFIRRRREEARREPVSRARVGAVRGVNVDAVMRTLVSRGLVEEAGHDPETGAVLYRTTQYFLHRIGLRSLDELPALAPFLPEVDALDELGVGGAL